MQDGIFLLWCLMKCGVAQDQQRRQQWVQVQDFGRELRCGSHQHCGNQCAGHHAGLQRGQPHVLSFSSHALTFPQAVKVLRLIGGCYVIRNALHARAVMHYVHGVAGISKSMFQIAEAPDSNSWHLFGIAAEGSFLHACKGHKGNEGSARRGPHLQHGRCRRRWRRDAAICRLWRD